MLFKVWFKAKPHKWEQIVHIEWVRKLCWKLVKSEKERNTDDGDDVGDDDGGDEVY